MCYSLRRCEIYNGLVSRLNNNNIVFRSLYRVTKSPLYIIRVYVIYINSTKKNSKKKSFRLNDDNIIIIIIITGLN